MFVYQICNDLYKWMQDRDRYGEVNSVFKSTINILSDDGKFIPIVINNKPISPNSIKLSENIDFRNFDIHMGSRVRLTRYILNISNINIYLKDPKLWNKSIELVDIKDTYDNLQLKIETISDFILDKGDKSGIFNLMQFISKEQSVFKDTPLEDQSQFFIKDRFISFMDAFKNHHMDSINSYSKKIIGFGQGLTPSMDDFISGLMISNIYISYFLGLSMEKAYTINQEIVGDIENKTTFVSEEMLMQSSIGETNEDIRNLMVAIIGTSRSERLNELLVKVIDYGHSSGTDILCGIYAGICILMGRDDEFKDS